MSSQIDPSRTVDLDNGWAASVCVGPDGGETCWLLSPQPGEPTGCICADCAPHEQDGPLPLGWHRVGSSTYDYPTCGALTTTTGQPCRFPVTRPGDRCHHHHNSNARRRTA
ncbi:hypothetical protein [Nocardioides silvaticus]|uniref:hypothetical protein n=1 Tax=Nocardioides silvaticus TaxID=2201891 RepID=UPI0011B1E2CE|nr:hypothetical protein [Nocardioides silvaticus]